MSIRIRLSKAAILPMDSPALKSNGLRIWCAGESGSGKSTCVALVASQLIAGGGQVVALDMHGELERLWEINPSRVQRIGYGGDPVSQNSVEWCLQEIRAGKSLLIDLSHWTLLPKELDTFVLEFMRGLFDLRRRYPKQTMLIVEEAAALIPQQQQSGQSENIAIFLRVVAEGRKFGLNFMLCSQQQSLVDVRAVKGCNMHVLLRISTTSDWKVIRPYIPKKLNVEFGTDDKRYDIRHFRDGEALLISRWTGSVRVQLNQPEVGPRKFLEEAEERGELDDGDGAEGMVH